MKLVSQVWCFYPSTVKTLHIPNLLRTTYIHRRIGTNKVVRSASGRNSISQLGVRSSRGHTMRFRALNFDYHAEAQYRHRQRDSSAENHRHRPVIRIGRVKHEDHSSQEAVESCKGQSLRASQFVTVQEPVVDTDTTRDDSNLHSSHNVDESDPLLDGTSKLNSETFAIDGWSDKIESTTHPYQSSMRRFDVHGWKITCGRLPHATDGKKCLERAKRVGSSSSSSSEAGVSVAWNRLHRYVQLDREMPSRTGNQEHSLAQRLAMQLYKIHCNAGSDTVVNDCQSYLLGTMLNQDFRKSGLQPTATRMNFSAFSRCTIAWTLPTHLCQDTIPMHFLDTFRQRFHIDVGNKGQTQPGRNSGGMPLECKKSAILWNSRNVEFSLSKGNDIMYSLQVIKAYSLQHSKADDQNRSCDAESQKMHINEGDQLIWKDSLGVTRCRPTLKPWLTLNPSL